MARFGIAALLLGATAVAVCVAHIGATPAADARAVDPKPGRREARLDGPQDAGAATLRTCVRVIDGDTIVLDGGERVRYIGIDTPETKHPRKPVERMGREATEANRRLVEGKRVRLEHDVQRRDRYGRTLAYVYVGATMANERLVRAGYAKASSYPPNVTHQERLVAAQRAARAESRGLWGGGADPALDPLLDPGVDVSAFRSEAPPRSSVDARVVYVTRTGERYHAAGCPSLRSSAYAMRIADARASNYTPCRRCRP